MMKDLVEYIARNLVNNPEAVKVTEIRNDFNITIELSVDPTDAGKIIGKDGRVVKAIRTLVGIIAAREGKRVNLEVI
jgi:uncharacterized protein